MANDEGTTIRRQPVFDIYDYVTKLEEQVRLLQTEKSLIVSKNSQMEVEFQRMKKELELMRKPPLIVGIVQEINLLDNTAVVRNSNGLEFLVEFEETHKNEIKDGCRVAMSQRSLKVIKVLNDIKDPRAKAMQVIEKPEIDFSFVGGLKKEIRELEEAVILPLISPEKFEKLGIEAPNGILLHGETGTGKTLLAKAIAHKTNSTFIKITASELVRKYIGEGAGLVRDVFKLAEEKKPSIIFIDELDAIGTLRTDETSGGDREVQRTLMQLLSEMDGFKKRNNVAIIGATNRIDVIDPALLRPGRFDRIVEVPLPDVNEREEIFAIHSSLMPLKDVDLRELAELTDSSSGAEIKAICMEAGILALREEIDFVSQKYFLQAIEKVLGSEEKDDEKMFS
ncbi:AAA family ATPase [Candidatus Micrarchaeota archaeon]|nr:AAA family ATPase [Candidatus Micrarchaeota archaeon]MBU2476537.1 AAA family ATPase [Candidatus Micrarchaeota archaeon]